MENYAEGLMDWDLLYDVPLIRQESHYTCWYAALMMVKGGSTPRESWQALRESACQKQREEATSSLGIRPSLSDRIKLGELYSSATQPYYLLHWIPWGVQKVTGKSVSARIGYTRGQRVGFDTGNGFDLRELRLKFGMAPLKIPNLKVLAKKYMRSANDLREQRITLKDYTDYAEIILSHAYQLMRKALDSYGPLMISVDAGSSRHMICINGIGSNRQAREIHSRRERTEMLISKAEPQFPRSVYGQNEYINTTSERGLIERKEVQPTGGYLHLDSPYWLHIIDPEAGRYQDEEGDYDYQLTLDTSSIQAKCCPMSLNQLLTDISSIDDVIIFSNLSPNKSALSQNRQISEEHNCCALWR